MPARTFIRAIVSGGLAAALLVAVPLGAAAQTFSCAEATNCTEQVICSTPQLGRLDERMSDLYFRLRDESSRRGARELLQSQRAWLADRNACGCNANCLVKRYQGRIQLFQDILND